MHYRCVLQDFLVAHPQYPPEKVVEALDILAANKQITIYTNTILLMRIVQPLYAQKKVNRQTMKGTIREKLLNSGCPLCQL